MTLLEIGIRAIATEVRRKIENNEEEKKSIEEYNSPKKEKERDISSYIKYLFDAIDNDDFEFVFENIEPNYRRCIFDDDIEKMKAYINGNIPKAESRSVIDVSSKGMIYKVSIGFDCNDGYTSRIYSLISSGDSYTIRFGNYDSIIFIDKFQIVDNVKYNLKYSYTLQNTLSYVLEITNISEERVNVQIENSRLNLPTGRYIEGSSSDLINLEPNESKEVIVVFKDSDYGKYGIEFDVKINEKSETLVINMK